MQGCAFFESTALAIPPLPEAVERGAALRLSFVTGTVDSRATSHQAAMVALNVDGVRSVKNEIAVARGSQEPRLDGNGVTRRRVA